MALALGSSAYTVNMSTTSLQLQGQLGEYEASSPDLADIVGMSTASLQLQQGQLGEDGAASWGLADTVSMSATSLQQQEQLGEHGATSQGHSRWYSEAGLWRRHGTNNTRTKQVLNPAPDTDNVLKTVDVDGSRKRIQVTRGVFSRMSNGGEDKPACKKLRKQLLCCRICQGDYVRPKVLPCLHTFCEQCLISEVPAHSLAVTCPTCRQQSILPLEGVSALRDNVVLIRLMDAMEQLVSCAICQTGSAVSSCLDCVNSFCKPCATTHVELEPGHTIAALTASCVQLTEETSAGGEGEKSSCELMSCPKHSGQQLDLYCAECETIICATCSSRAGEHEGHPASPLASTVEEHKRRLQDLLNTVKAQLAAIQSSMDSIKSTSASLLDNYRAAETRVRECFDMLSRTLLERKESLLNSLEATYRSKHERLAKQLRDLQEAAGGMSNSCVFTESALGRASELEMLLVRKEMTDTLARLSVNNRLQTTQIETDELAFAESNLLNLINIVKGFGTIEPSSEQPCLACDVETSGGGLQWCYVGQESTINISVNSPQPDVDPSSALTAHIASLTGGDVVTPSITRPSPGNYSVVYTAPRVGTYQIELRLGGHQVAGSPFIVLALAAGDTGEAESSSAGDAPDDFLSSKRSVSIVDNKNKVRGRGAKRPGTTPRSRSCAANLDGNMMAKMGRKGNGKGEFANPLGVCYSQGKCVVADSNNQCIQVFTNMGICKLRFGIRGSLPGQLRKPTSVATLPSGNFVVADYDNKCVTMFSPDGKYISRLGVGKLEGPKGLCVDQRGNIVVVDNKASCVFVFQPNGKLLLKFGSRGGGDSQFSGLYFCAATPQNDYVVTDSHNHCVKMFDATGAFKFSFGSQGLGNGQFNTPTGVAVDNKGNILVADWGNSRIQVFDCRGTFLSLVNTTANPLYGPQGLCLTTNGHVLVADSGNQCLKIFKYKSAALSA